MKEILFRAGSGISPFRSEEKSRYPALNRDEDCQVLILGGGLCGLILAAVCVQHGWRTTVVTQGLMGGRRCRYSDGLLRCELPGGLDGLRRKVGNRAALSAWKTMYDGLKGLSALVRKTDLRCEFRIRDSLLFSETEQGRETLREEYLLRRHSEFPVRFLEKEEGQEMFSFPLSGGLLAENAGVELNPVAFARDLASWLSVTGCILHENTRIELLKGENDGIVCRGNKKQLRAEMVIDARGAFALESRPELGRTETVFRIATGPGQSFSGWDRQCLLTDTDTGIRMRTTPDGRLMASGQESRLLLPCARKDSGLLRRRRYRMLEEMLAEMFLGANNEESVLRFCQTQVSTPDGLPYFGADPELKGLYYVWCFGENGLLFAEPAGQFLCAHFAGKGDLPPFYSV